MSSQTVSTSRTNEPEGSKIIRLASKPPLIQITKGRDLFMWMWRQLERSEPQVPVTAHMVESLENLFRTIRAGRSMVGPPIEWSDIFTEVRWDNLYDRSGPRCAEGLLTMVGRLCDTVIQAGGGRVPHIRACEMMLQYWDRLGPYIKHQDGRRGTYLVSTSACERKFGVRIRVKLMDEPLDEDWWTFRGLT